MTTPTEPFDKKKALQAAIYYLTDQDAFYGNFLQELVIQYNTLVPTAGITFNEKAKQYEVYINPNFFASLSLAERVGVFHHEVLHFTHKHLFRFPFNKDTTSPEQKKLYNIAGDMEINQFIKVLPEGCVNYKEWLLDDGSPFPALQSMETYYELIKKEADKQKQNQEKKEKGEGEGTKGNVNEQLDKFKEFDTHAWDSLDEETKKQMLEEAKKVLKRTVEKTQFSHSNVPDSIRDLLEEIDGLAAGINYKQILKNAIRRSVSTTDREHTWKRPNKRYGTYSPGSKLGDMPKLAFFNDSSGSISITEQNVYLGIMDEFLKVGSRNCTLGFWHTQLYYKKPYRKGQRIKHEDLESGGTDVKCVLEDIAKSKYELAIILTDGYYDKVDVKPSGEVIWIISEGGQKDHPMAHVGKTIMLKDLK